MAAKKNSNPVASVTRDGDQVHFVLWYPPTAASRPRVTRWGTYYTKTYKAYQDAAEQAIPHSNRPPIQGELAAYVEFICHKPKTTKLLSPRGDIDNHLKAIFDAIVGKKKNPHGYIEDDMQISKVHAVKRYAKPNELPHTRIHIEPL